MDPLSHMKNLESEGKISPNVLTEFETTIESPSLNDLLTNWLSRTPINGSLPSESNDNEVVSSYINGHLDAMNVHSKNVISHFKSIGHGNESTLEDRLQKSIQARDFLIPNGEINRSRADYCLLSPIATSALILAQNTHRFIRQSRRINFAL